MSFRRGILMAWEDNPSSPAWSRVLTKGLHPLEVSMALQWRVDAGVTKLEKPVLGKIPYL